MVVHTAGSVWPAHRSLLTHFRYILHPHMTPTPVHTPDPSTLDHHPARWRALTLLSTALLLGMSLWFAASAVGAELGTRWGLSATEVGGLTSLVQLGSLLGARALAILNVGDLTPAPRLFAVCAVTGAAANALLLVVPSYGLALVTRAVTGFALAGRSE